jgi:hypothetical protein
MKIAGAVHIYRCRFSSEHSVHFNRSEFLDVFGTNATFGGPVSFQGCRFRKGARFLSRCSFEGPVEFYFSQFDEEGNFGGATFKNSLNLQNTYFAHSLMFFLKGGEEATFDDTFRKVTIDLRGCKYNSLELQKWDTHSLNEFVSRIFPYERSVFIGLEGFLIRSGKIELANSVRYGWNYDEGRQLAEDVKVAWTRVKVTWTRREGKALLESSWRWFRALWPWFQNWIVGFTAAYGTNMVKLAALILILTILPDVVDWLATPHTGTLGVRILEFVRTIKPGWHVLGAGIVLAILGQAILRRVKPEFK